MSPANSRTGEAFRRTATNVPHGTQAAASTFRIPTTAERMGSAGNGSLTDRSSSPEGTFEKWTWFVMSSCSMPPTSIERARSGPGARVPAHEAWHSVIDATGVWRIGLRLDRFAAN